MLFYILLGITFLISTGIQLLFLKFRDIRQFIKEINFTKTDSCSLPTISVIICAKNEAKNLNICLPALLQQDYPAEKWEVIVVDDASTDNTALVLNDFKTRFKQLSTIPVPPGVNRQLPGKKYALHQALKAAQFEFVLLTDADCLPAGDQWIKLFAKAQAKSQKQIILGFGAYEKKSSFLNKLIQWETFKTGMQYLGMAAAGLPYMGVGRNLMYKKELYFQAFQHNHFQEIYASIPSGDDDLLICQIANSTNTGFCTYAGAQTISQPANNFKQWFRQKKRHFSAGKYYPRKVKQILGLWELSQGLFWLIWIISCFGLIYSLIFHSNRSILIFLAVIFVLGLTRTLVYWVNAERWRQQLNAKSAPFFYPIGEICFSIIELLLSPYIFWKDKKKWK